jgi:hypothetical protein
MANLKLTLACWDYDRTRALFEGRVKVEGVDLELWSTHKNRALMGESFWPYGIEANRKTLEACLRHHREQGILKRSYNIEELFAPETRMPL